MTSRRRVVVAADQVADPTEVEWVARFGNEEDLLHRYAVRYVPGQQIYFRLAQPQAKADAVWFNEDPDRPRVQIRVHS